MLTEIVDRTISGDYDDLNSALAGAGLHRAAELLLEAAALVRHIERPVSAGILIRGAYEFWAWATYLLVGGEDATVALEIERLTQEIRVANNNDLHMVLPTLKANLEESKDHFNGRKLPSTTLRDIVEHTGPMVASVDDGRPENLVPAYDMIYRGHSLLDTHPAKVIHSMVDPFGSTIRLRPYNPWDDVGMQVGIVPCTWACLRAGWPSVEATTPTAGTRTLSRFGEPLNRNSSVDDLRRSWRDRNHSRSRGSGDRPVMLRPLPRVAISGPQRTRGQKRRAAATRRSGELLSVASERPNGQPA